MMPDKLVKTNLKVSIETCCPICYFVRKKTNMCMITLQLLASMNILRAS